MSDETRSASLKEIPVLLFVRGATLLTVMVTLLGSLHWYLGLRLIRDTGLPGAAWGVIWTLFAVLLGGFIGGRLLPRPAAKVLQWFGFMWMGAFGLLVTGFAVSDLVLLIAGKFATPQADWELWRTVTVLAVVGPTLAWGFYVSGRPATKRITIDIPGLHQSLDGFRIVQLSDVHIGETLDRRFAKTVTDHANGLKPDLIAVTGDLIDGAVHKLRDEVQPLSELRAEHGVYYVTGNHEYYHGGSAWQAEARRLGFTVLHNEHVVVADGKLVIGGVPDVEGGNFSPAHAPDAHATFASAPVDVPRILLAHQPRFAKAAAAVNVALMLSGHTHGGQIFPFMFFVKLQQPVIGGFSTLHGVPTYTSNGTGYWGPPFRIGARGEVTEVTLRAA